MDYTSYFKLAEELRENYVNASPFPHYVFDNFFPTDTLHSVVKEYLAVPEDAWFRINEKEQLKRSLSDDTRFGKATREFIRELNSRSFLKFLEILTGIDCLLPDADLEGGGLHQIYPGGHLAIHSDFNKHPRSNLDRRLNVLIYLNEEWQESWGGQLELWDVKMTRAQKKITPVFNRMVVFSTTDFSYHGHPEILKCPEGLSRKSIALYYYSNGRPAGEVNLGYEKHSTWWQNRPCDKREWSARKIVKSLLPPIIPASMVELRKRLR